MKLTIKLFLIVTLFCSTVLADGDMGEGSRDNGDGNGGGFACVECVENETNDNDGGSILMMIQKFIFGVTR